MRVAIIAGTPVDTRMGVEYIKKKNREVGSQRCEPIYLPAASDCDDQLRFQYSDYDKKRSVIDGLFIPEIEKGTRDFFVYCNSLAGSFDFDSYEEEKNKDAGDSKIRIYTPLKVYKRLAREYKCVGVMAANNLSAHGIEEALMAGNPDIYAIGTGNMQIVRMIEDGCDPGEIADSLALEELLTYMEASGAEAVILGCTHFPYLKSELERLADLPIIDPADEMYRELLNQ